MPAHAEAAQQSKRTDGYRLQPSLQSVRNRVLRLKSRPHKLQLLAKWAKESMKALKVCPECPKLPLMLLKVVEVLLPFQGNATILHPNALRHQFGNLPV